MDLMQKIFIKLIKNLTIKIYRLCSGVKGMSANEQRKIGKLIKNGQKIDTYSEIKQQKRQNIILQKADEFLNAPSEIERIMQDGAQKARTQAQIMLKKLKYKLGLSVV